MAEFRTRHMKGHVAEANLQGPLAVVADAELTVYRSGTLSQARSAHRSQIELYANASAIHYRLGLALLALDAPTVALEMMRSEPDSGYRKLVVRLALDALGRKSVRRMWLSRCWKKKIRSAGLIRLP
jgi:hypothetical protein